MVDAVSDRVNRVKKPSSPRGLSSASAEMPTVEHSTDPLDRG